MSSRFVAASDAAQEAVREGLAGALCPTGWVPAGPGHAGLPNLVWPLLELAVVLMTLAYMVTDLHGHHGIWWADNIAALMALGFEDGAMSMSWTLWLRWLMLVDMVLGTFGIVTTALLS